MKSSALTLAESDQDSKKKMKFLEVEEKAVSSLEAADLGEDLVLEILKGADARTLARAACVSRRWRRMVEDERIWEAVCTRHWASIGYRAHQLRAVVLALGGFRRLQSVYLLPLLQPWHMPRRGFPSLAPPVAGKAPGTWGRDEVQLSMALLSIGHFEKMNSDFGAFNKGGSPSSSSSSSSAGGVIDLLD